MDAGVVVLNKSMGREILNGILLCSSSNPTPSCSCFGSTGLGTGSTPAPLEVGLFNCILLSTRADKISHD